MAIEELGLRNAGLMLFVRVFWRFGIEQEGTGIAGPVERSLVREGFCSAEPEEFMRQRREGGPTG